ncbi:MAG: cysteine hydrolase family protein [Lachnospiraceae bacterium]|jgi:nicotinamidase/pyrazinamidase
MKKLLVIVDMQKDFVDGALGTKEAQAIVEPVAEKIRREKANGAELVFTLDTHTEDYMNTQEGKHLPVIHCVKNTPGWMLTKRLQPLAEGERILEKPTFGSMELAGKVQQGGYDEIELIGLCTDICVISNAMLVKAAAPEVPVFVDASCCAGVTPQSHANALEAMKMCQIGIR